MGTARLDMDEFGSHGSCGQLKACREACRASRHLELVCKGSKLSA